MEREFHWRQGQEVPDDWPSWLREASIEWCHVTLVDDDVHWHNGVWHGGVWEYGVWENGGWGNGTWHAGTWRGGTWHDGVWYQGVWYGGVWNKGTWHSVPSSPEGHLGFSSGGYVVMGPDRFEPEEARRIHPRDRGVPEQFHGAWVRMRDALVALALDQRSLGSGTAGPTFWESLDSPPLDSDPDPDPDSDSDPV